MFTGRRRCRGCSPRCIPLSASRWSAPWSANILARRLGSAIWSRRPEAGWRSAAGLGYLIQQGEGVFDIAGVFAGMFVLSVFVILIDLAVTSVERRLLVWRPTVSEGRGW